MDSLCRIGLCINPETKRPYPVTIIEKGLKDIHFSVKQGRSTKQQALEAIQQLKSSFPIERAQMRLRISIQNANIKQVLEKIQALGKIEEKEIIASDLTAVRQFCRNPLISI